VNLKHQTKTETMGDQEEMGIEFEVDKAWGLTWRRFLDTFSPGASIFQPIDLLPSQQTPKIKRSIFRVFP
jgi:hypothetical protein